MVANLVTIIFVFVLLQLQDYDPIYPKSIDLELTSDDYTALESVANHNRQLVDGGYVTPISPT